MNMTGLKLEHLYKSYDDVKAVKDVAFECRDSSFIVLAGPSGCGKSTLMNMIAGFLKSDQGHIYINDICVDEIQPNKRNIAMVFQDPALFAHMSVYDNIAIGLGYSGLNKDEVQNRVLKCAKLVCIDDLLKRKARALSSGQKMRVSIARALVREPVLFLMDEPLSALDARLKSQLRIEIAQLYRQMDASFIYVTHDQIEAMTLADILIIMNDGCFQQIGKPMEIYNNPCNLFTANFLGKFEMNQFVVQVVDRCICFQEKRKKIDATRDVKALIMALRPQHIHMRKNQGYCGYVVLIENLGDELFYHIKWKDQMIVVKDHRSSETKVGDMVWFDISFEDALFFDTSSKARVYI